MIIIGENDIYIRFQEDQELYEFSRLFLEH